MSLQIDAKPLTEGSKAIPTHARAADAGFDLHATISATIKPFERILVPCGFAMAIPEGYAGLVLPRSGLASKHGITVANAPGLIDSNYRGEVMACLVNLDPNEAFKIEVGDRIAQLLIIKVPDAEFNMQEDLSATERGAAGFGSSGLL